MNINDKIRSKGTLSPSVTGVIIAIYDPIFYREMIVPYLAMTAWDEAFPDWRLKNVYIIQKDFAEPAYKPELLPVEITNDPNLLEHYMKPVKYSTYAEDELEIFDWVVDLQQKIS